MNVEFTSSSTKEVRNREPRPDGSQPQELAGIPLNDVLFLQRPGRDFTESRAKDDECVHPWKLMLAQPLL